MGLFFENLCIRDLRIYADALDGQIYHYRDRNDLECDAVIHLRNGDFALVEIKLAANIDTTKMKSPAFKMILTAVGNYAYQRNDGILIVPIGCLKN